MPQIANFAGPPPKVSGAPRTIRGADVEAPVSKNAAVKLERAGWLTTVAICLIAVAILLLQGYLGYAAVTFAVALSAAINLR